MNDQPSYSELHISDLAEGTQGMGGCIELTSQFIPTISLSVCGKYNIKDFSAEDSLLVGLALESDDYCNAQDAPLTADETKRVFNAQTIR